MRIERKLAMCKTVLFSDSEYFNKNVTGIKTLSDLKDWFQIKGRLVKIYECGNKISYKLSNSDYNFTLTLIM